MANVARPMLIDYQVSLHWPRRRRHQSRFSGLGELLRLWRLRIRQRADLARFGERELHDIG
jgi:uncharacterized protein YjiS (DUF1127 family)